MSSLRTIFCKEIYLFVGIKNFWYINMNKDTIFKKQKVMNKNSWWSVSKIKKNIFKVKNIEAFQINPNNKLLILNIYQNK